MIPFGICAALLVCLLVLALLGKGYTLERIVLAGITFVTVALFLIARDRRIKTTDQEIHIRKFFRTKEISRNEINHIGSVILRNRVYLLLTTTRGFFILSNAYENFSGLVRDLVEKIDPEKVEEEVRTQGKSSLKSRTDVISLWLAVVVIFGIIVLKMSSI
jgi:lysylphosphatidylglycerol synthetase-like protein (DUF2156 family)